MSKNNEVVKYHNDMNKVNLGSFSQKELDLFFSICFKVKEFGVNVVKIPFSDIKILINEKENLKRTINGLNKKMAQLNYQFEVSPNVFERFVLFTNFITNFNDKTLTIKVNDSFEYMLNNLVGNFTKFDLMEFVNLKSCYSKNMFKLLKQWESVKVKEFSIEEFREVLSIPPGYRMSIIDTKVLKPIAEELSKCFPGLKIEKIKTGRSISSIKFAWERAKADVIFDNQIDTEDEFIEISDELYFAFEKAKKNRFIQKILTEENEVELVESFQEGDLIKGLAWAYAEIKQEISSVNYLKKVIQTSIENEKKPKKRLVRRKTTVPEDKEVEEIFSEEKHLINLDKKETLSKEEYEEKYQEYLKKNNAEHTPFSRRVFDNVLGKKYIVK